jgi:hypothetical protein
MEQDKWHADETDAFGNADDTDAFGNADDTDAFGNAYDTDAFGNAYDTDTFGNADLHRLNKKSAKICVAKHLRYLRAIIHTSKP